MSGKIVNNVFRASGVIAATPGGLDWSTAVQVSLNDMLQ